MSASPQAVFLSYAHEDAVAAAQLAEALRAAGVEVWFDRSELRGGDAWDRKIRKQIKECALFVPVISQGTQARKEGYFRLEWRLAEQRTHLMGKNAAFVVPVCVDDTKDEEADVPDAFLDVQWTRLRKQPERGAFDGLALSEFTRHVKSLIACRDIQLAPAPFGMTVAEQPAETPVPTTTSSSQQPAALAENAGRRVPTAVWIIPVVGVVAALVYFFIVTKPPNAGAETRPAAAEKAASPKVEGKSIAVLPFKNQSPDPANAFFTDGVHEDILTSLFNIRELHVISRTSVEQYRDTKKTVRQIGEELRVAYVLEGSVQRVDNKVRVTGQLIDARTDRHAWAKSFDKELSDILVIQSELAQAIATELKAVLSPEEKKLIADRLTQNATAYDLYLQAREIRRTSFTRGFRWGQAEALLQAALALDPKFTEAWAMLCYVHTRIYVNSNDRSEARLGKARTALETARRLAPTSSEVTRAQADYHMAQREFALAAEQFEKLVRLQPNNADIHHQLGEVAERQGRWGVMLAERRRAVELDPGNLASQRALLVSLYWSRRYDEELATQRRFAAMRPDSLADAFTLALIPFQASGSTKEAEQFLGTLTPAQADSPQGLAMRKGLAVLTGNAEEFDRLWQRNKSAGANFGIIGVRGEWAQNYPVIMRKAAGDLEGARQMLERNRADLLARSAAEADNDTIWAALGRVEALLGHREEALRYALRAVELVPESVDAFQGTTRRRDLAFVYAWTGDKERAIAECARLLQQPTGFNVHELGRGLEFTPLRGDSRFEALLNDPKNNAPLF